MTDDIVTRLREFGDSYGLDYEAADEIERLRADRDRWRKIAEQLFLWLHPSPEDDSVYEAGVEAMTMYEQAVRGE